MSMLARPLPDPDAFARTYWDHARRHELRLPVCDDCGQARAYDTPSCPRCGSDGFHWKRMSGRGNVWSYCIFHKTFVKGLESQLPYNAAVVKLDEGPLLVSSIVVADNNGIRIGMAVQATFEDVSADQTVIRFLPE